MNNKKSFTLNIEGKEYEWDEQTITGTELKKIANLKPETELFLMVDDPWDDEPVLDETVVNLGRPEIEKFLVKRELRFSVNGRPFKWHQQYIRGAQLRKLAAVPDEEDIFLQLDGNDEQIEEDQKVNLARPGVEHFVSREVKFEVTIIVGGTPHLWKQKKISFKEVIILGYGEYIDRDTMVYTVAYEDGPRQNPEGSMTKEQTVFVKNKMIFHVTANDKS